MTRGPRGGASAGGRAIRKHLAGPQHLAPTRTREGEQRGRASRGGRFPAEVTASAKALPEDKLRPDTQTGPSLREGGGDIISPACGQTAGTWLSGRRNRGRDRALQQRSQCPDISGHSGPTGGEGPRQHRLQLSHGKLATPPAALLPRQRPNKDSFCQAATGSLGGYFWLPEKGRCCLFIYRLYFWMGVGKRLFLVRWWVVFC